MKEEKKINLYTKAVQIEKSGEKNEMEFYVEATLVEKNGIIYITYKESELSGMEGTTTTLRISDDSLSILRFGAYNSKLEFKRGEQTLTNYQTPYGNIAMTIDTRLLDMDLHLEEKSSIQLKYSLQANGEEPMQNEINISYK